MSATSSSKTAEQDSVVGQVAEAAHDAVSRVADRAIDAESAIRTATAESSEALGEKVDSAKEGLTSLTADVRQYVAEKPVTSAGIAFATGIIVSLLLRR